MVNKSPVPPFNFATSRSQTQGLRLEPTMLADMRREPE